jgi:diadenosine tetraphosphate (Ap4A) HIT family hydrolase
MDTPRPCPFCDLPADRIVSEGPLVRVLRDGYPVSDGHTLIIPRRHIPTVFEATDEEKAALWAAVDAVKAELDRSHCPDGYNVGFNSGTAAGQTVMHAHIHVIPRYTGDMDDPRGGVRHAVEGKGRYELRGEG